MASYHEIVDVMLDCRGCGRSFKRTAKRQIYCATRCRRKTPQRTTVADRRPLMRVCDCGVSFVATGKGLRCYCSEECRKRSRLRQAAEFQRNRRQRRRDPEFRERELAVEALRRHQKSVSDTPEQRRYLAWRNKLVNQYRISEETYWRLFSSQDCECAICGNIKPTKFVGSATGWHPGFVIDHDHVTGHVRGILCALCNVGLGAFLDRASVLGNAISYLSLGVANG